MDLWDWGTRIGRGGEQTLVAEGLGLSSNPASGGVRDQSVAEGGIGVIGGQRGCGLLLKRIGEGIASSNDRRIAMIPTTRCLNGLDAGFSGSRIAGRLCPTDG